VFLDLLSALIVVGLNSFDNLVQSTSVTGLNSGDSHTGSGLPAANTSKPGLILNNAVGHSHLSAKGGQKQNELNGVNIISDNDQLGLFLLNQGGNGINTMVYHGLPLGRLVVLTLGAGLSASFQALLALLLGLGTVIVQKSEQLQSGLPVQSRLELVDWGRDLQTGLKNGLLPLEPNVFGPSHESAQIPLRLNTLTNLEVAGSGHEKGVLDPLNFGLLDSQGGGCDLLSLLLGLSLNHVV